MTTRKEDAVSIIGEEIHDETFAEKEEDELKSLVIKSEPVEEVKAKAKKDEKEEDEEDDEKKKDKKKEEKAVIEESAPHVLYSEVESFLSTYDMVAKSDLAYAEKLKAVQDAYEQFGREVAESFSPTKQEKELEALDEIKSMLAQLLSRQDVTEQELAMLKQKGLSSNPQEVIPQAVRRSLTVDSLQAIDPAQNVKPGSIRDLANKAAGF